MSHMIMSVVVLFSVGAGPASEDPAWYHRGQTWQESLLRSREALLSLEAAQGTTRAPQFGPWYCLGPIAISEANAALETRLLAERHPDWDAEYATGADERRRWDLRLAYKDGWVHKLYSGEHLVYLRRTITAAAPATLPLHLDAVGRMTVWLNGEPAAPSIMGRISYSLGDCDVRLRPAAVPLNLRSGDNDLLVKIELRPQPRPRDDKDPWRKDTLEARRPWGTVFTGHSTLSGPAIEYEKCVYGEVSHLYCSPVATLGPVADTGVRDRERLWRLLQRDFVDDRSRQEMSWERNAGVWAWDWRPGDLRALAGRYAGAIRRDDLATQARQLATQATDEAGLQAVRELYYRFHTEDSGDKCARDAGHRQTLLHQIASLRLAITDLRETHGAAYPAAEKYLKRLSAIKDMAEQAASGPQPRRYAQAWTALEALRREALLANPLLDFDRLLVVKRRANPFVPDLPLNWEQNSSIPSAASDNEIAVLSPIGSGPQLTTIFKPEGQRFVGDLDLHFDGQRLLFSMPGAHGRWQVFEIGADGAGLRQVTRGDEADVDSFDACYLPGGKIMFCSTAMFAGVPCVRGTADVAVLFVMDEDGGSIRQVGFEQDQDFHPAVLNDGRVLYTRWEYADTPHFFSRLLFSMNPDGTDQKAVYGSNSYWPNSIFYARPVPQHPTKIIGVVSGHHGVRRAGELVLFDPAQGEQEAAGVVQRIPGRGHKVEPVINDRLVIGSWPRFLHPFPLSDKYFLVSCRMSEESRWGVYLVDVFDNMLLLHEEDGHDLLEPIPLRSQPRPPVIPERVDRNRQDALISLVDVYAGPGLEGVPRGTVKSLRVIAYHYAYQGMADDSRAIGVDSSWDMVKRVLGAVPVHEDGSALFRAPANTPLTVQPLDREGKAVQLMRSWMTAMPGETLSCVGCHASSKTAPPAGSPLALQREPSTIQPWRGPARGFSFQREVQPVLQKYCVGCHNGSPRPEADPIPDFTSRESTDPRGFSPAYLELQRFVTRPGAESDYHLLPAAEYHADVSELVQLLEKGHHGVQLDAEAWDRLITWIDLNVPFHGTWREAQGEERVAGQDLRRRCLQQLYAGVEDDPERIIPVDLDAIQPILPEPKAPRKAPVVEAPGWPFDAAEARRRQRAAGPVVTRTVDLGDGVVMRMSLIPAGEFVMGDPQGYADEAPRRERIAAPFWIGQCEVTNQQFAQFDPAHDSRYIRTHGITSTRGYAVNLPEQPVVRVSWRQAEAFCRWLSQKTGEEFDLPTEAQWEYACRAGAATSLAYGDLDADFSGVANLADRQVEHLRDYSHNATIGWLPRDERYDDGAMVTAPAGRFRPNAWGLHDMHGNAAEWTRSHYASTNADKMVVRGGSWRDRPHRSRAAFRIGYPTWQQVHDVGFRVICEATSSRSQEASQSLSGKE